MLRFITKKPDILDNSLYLYMVFTTTIPVEPTIREHIKTSGGGGGDTAREPEIANHQKDGVRQKDIDLCPYNLKSFRIFCLLFYFLCLKGHDQKK